MRILVDLTYIRADTVAGVTNYSYRLLSGFKECGFQKHVILLCTKDNMEIIRQHVAGYDCICCNLRETRFPHFRGILNNGQLEKIIKKENVDVFFAPYIAFPGLYTNKIPFVGVLHDAQGFSLKSNRLKQLAYNVFTKRILGKLSALVTISNYAKKDILGRLPKLKLPISVIYNSITPPRNAKIKKKGIPYILNVNTLEPYKNLITLVKAFNLIKGQIPHNLYVKAKKLPYWDNVIAPYLMENGLQNRVCLIDACYSEEEMDELYYNADLFVSPSLMEGFGFTPIEAALHEVPVVCSKETALYETTMGLLNYYEPATDEQALKGAILMTLNKKQTNLSDIATAYERTYSAKHQAQEFMSLFEKIMERNEN